MKTSTLTKFSAIALLGSCSVWAADPALPEPLISVNLAGLDLTQVSEALHAQTGAKFFVLLLDAPQPGPDVSLSAVPLSQALKVIAAAYQVCTAQGRMGTGFIDCRAATADEPKGPRLGVALLATESAAGAEVRHIQPDSVAFRAGIQTGDLIVGFNGSPISGASQLRQAVSALQPGTTVTVEVLRNGRRQSLVAKF